MSTGQVPTPAMEALVQRIPTDNTQIEHYIIDFGDGRKLRLVDVKLYFYSPPPASEVGDAIRQLWQENPHLDQLRMEGLALQVDDLWRRAQEHRSCPPITPPTDPDTPRTAIQRGQEWFEHLNQAEQP